MACSMTACWSAVTRMLVIRSGASGNGSASGGIHSAANNGCSEDSFQTGFCRVAEEHGCISAGEPGCWTPLDLFRRYEFDGGRIESRRVWPVPLPGRVPDDGRHDERKHPSCCLC